MRKTKVKVPAKINLTLDVTGVKDGYHQISSLVCQVSVYDVITVKKRKDGKITLKESGVLSGCETEKNNAYKAASLFLSNVENGGADVSLFKKIPVGGGLGGSSADIAGTLIALEKLYKTGGDVIALANALGSDSGYMATGGAAVISGRGDIIEPVIAIPTLYLIIVTESSPCSAKDSYAAYDELGKTYAYCTERAVNALKAGDVRGFLAALKNDLTEGSIKLVPKIKENLSALKAAGAAAAVMTGSGSCAYGIFLTKKERDKAYKKLYGRYGKRLIKAKTLK